MVSGLQGQSDVDSVRDATDLVRLIGEHIALRQKGREHVGLCPFHDDHTPSMCVVTHKGNAFYKCHSCGAGGDVFDFVMAYHRMEFAEALRFLADRSGITLRTRTESTPGSDHGGKRNALLDAATFASTFYQRMLRDDDSGAVARNFLKSRGMTGEFAKAFSVGVSPDQWDALSTAAARHAISIDSLTALGLIKPRQEQSGFYDTLRNRIIFPIADELGRVIAFGGRRIDESDEPKYLNTAESPLFSKSKTLYGLHLAKRSMVDEGRAIITEGYTDVIACHQSGIVNAVGTLGTALTTQHANKLSRLCPEVVLVFDGDEAGQKAADRAIEVFFTTNVDVRICVLPDGLDPDDLLRQPDGRERFLKSVEAAEDALQFKLNRLQSQISSQDGISARQRKLEEFLSTLSRLGIASLEGVRKQLILSRVAELVGMPVDQVQAAMPRQRIAQPVVEPKPASSSQSGINDVPNTSDSSRRRAELDVLALAIFEPQLLQLPVVAPDGREIRALETLAEENFSDPVARSIANAVRSRCQASEFFTVQQIVGDLEQRAERDLVTTLYFQGERCCADEPDGDTAAIQSAVSSLLMHIDRKQWQDRVLEFHRADDSNRVPDTARALIESRRKHGTIPAAIARGTRS